ncbi:transporter family protein [Shewanella fidelis]|uniref:Transporter n=1 Tax=Shewanella fidelis TaxID=173509 RepID=A0AAW8NPR0_9GAMM|nr:transporter [Shewanella fidelis]MDR8525194.1 transporter [Shewanella fidelis]MDW4811265.1 transporter [Shewanella fidelis]MDW4814956.1 transporter [Shewanella fidelis]MDW4819046.1 transporter [Shewanella fidelis]MDW4823277.1 transporter [Shewanella fidelis]
MDFKWTKVALLVSISSMPLIAFATDANQVQQGQMTEAEELQLLKKQLILLNQQLQMQQQAINQMAQKVLAKEAKLKQAAPTSTAQPTNTPPPEKVASNQQQNIQRPPQQSTQIATSNAQRSSQVAIKKEPERSRSTEDVLQEAHNVFDRKLTIEPSLTYSYYGRKDLVLRGFLALDAIFLGNLNLDRIRSNTVQLDLTTRYTLNDSWQFEMAMPFVYRLNKYESVGEGNSSQLYESEDVEGAQIGDMSVAAYYRIMTEGNGWPDWVWNVRVRMPTGEDPFGINLESSESGNLTYPDQIATGAGVWGISTGFSLAKTYDPAIVFFNLNYGTFLSEEYGDLSGLPGLSPGEIDLGDYIDYSLGLAFAVSERMSIGMSFNQRFFTKTRQKPLGGEWQDIARTDTNTANLGLGATLALTENFSMVTSIGAGLTEDSPDYQISLRFPYRF